MRSNSRRTSFWERFISNRKIQREPRTNSKLQSYCNPRAWRRRQVLRKRCSARKSSPMRRNFWKRARGRRGITRICLSCWRRLTRALVNRGRLSEPELKQRNYKPQENRIERGVAGCVTCDEDPGNYFCAATLFSLLPKRSEEHTSELQSHSDLVC